MYKNLGPITFYAESDHVEIFTSSNHWLFHFKKLCLSES